MASIPPPPPGESFLSGQTSPSENEAQSAADSPSPSIFTAVARGAHTHISHISHARSTFLITHGFGGEQKSAFGPRRPRLRFHLMLPSSCDFL